MSGFAMKPITLFLVTFLSIISTVFVRVAPRNVGPQITVMGFVYCDICSNNTFSANSYFIPGAEVRIDCKFRAATPRTGEVITFSMNRTTNKLGVYKLDIPSVTGVRCAEAAIANSCEASLVLSSSDSCNVPGHQTTTDQISFKSMRPNICIYSLNALNFRPPKTDITLCGK